MTGPSDRPTLAAPVAGFPAFVLAAILDEALPGRLVRLQRLVEEGRLHPERMAEVRTTWAAVRAAAAQWQDWRSVVDGSAAESITAGSEGLIEEREIDTDRAAALLGITANRVRQLARCGAVSGRKAGGRWLVDRTEIELRKGA